MGIPTNLGSCCRLDNPWPKGGGALRLAVPAATQDFERLRLGERILQVRKSMHLTISSGVISK